MPILSTLIDKRIVAALEAVTGASKFVPVTKADAALSDGVCKGLLAVQGGGVH
jgi:hypothetical protein